MDTLSFILRQTVRNLVYGVLAMAITYVALVYQFHVHVIFHNIYAAILFGICACVACAMTYTFLRKENRIKNKMTNSTTVQSLWKNIASNFGQLLLFDMLGLLSFIFWIALLLAIYIYLTPFTFSAA